ncbi:hypothetical protein QE152_g4506 [Popillia japonica]|uniref:Uncharacterized protein n=1 Tax=Popillia japonica TaxID=7064 RepID=A0AAW1N0N6_POPJA
MSAKCGQRTSSADELNPGVKCLCIKKQREDLTDFYQSQHPASSKSSNDSGFENKAMSAKCGQRTSSADELNPAVKFLCIKRQFREDLQTFTNSSILEKFYDSGFENKAMPARCGEKTSSADESNPAHPASSKSFNDSGFENKAMSAKCGQRTSSADELNPGVKCLCIKKQREDLTDFYQSQHPASSKSSNDSGFENKAMSAKCGQRTSSADELNPAVKFLWIKRQFREDLFQHPASSTSFNDSGFENKAMSGK